MTAPPAAAAPQAAKTSSARTNVPPPPAVATPVATPAAPASTSVASTKNGDDTALEIGGGALALLALGGAAFAIARRRRAEEEEEWYDEPAVEHDHAEPIAAEPMVSIAEPQQEAIAEQQPALVAPEVSAFSWGRPDPAAQNMDDGSDRRPGETWVERAYRGPSPANPSVSLKNRLRRAAFFDKREREAAEGRAQPVEAGAGLPDEAVEAQRELA